MNLVLSVTMLVAMALVAGAVTLWRRGARKQPALMVVLALVMVGNVVLAAWPVR